MSTNGGCLTGYVFRNPIFDLPVMYHDDQIIIVNKPPGMLSVPGRAVLTTMTVIPRAQQWKDAVLNLINEAGSRLGGKRGYCSLEDENMIQILTHLIEKGENIPRKEDKFKAYLSRVLRVEDKFLQDHVFRSIVARDDLMHRMRLDQIPDQLVSASDVASHMADEFVKAQLAAGSTDAQLRVRALRQQKVHHVHRLDMETSGLLMFAKDEHISAVLDEQFRNHDVRMHVQCTALHCIQYTF